MPRLHGFLQLCSSDGDSAVPVEGYPRVAWAANDVGRITETWPTLGERCPTGTEISHMALFDSDGGNGRLLLWWPLPPPHVVSPWPFPDSTQRLDLPPRVHHALNAPPGTNLIIGEFGDVVGTVDGAPLTAACRLVAHNGSICAGGMTPAEEAEAAAVKREERRAAKDAARSAFLNRPRLISSKRRVPAASTDHGEPQND